MGPVVARQSARKQALANARYGIVVGEQTGSVFGH
jgi:hypothetical protein